MKCAFVDCAGGLRLETQVVFVAEDSDWHGTPSAGPAIDCLTGNQLILRRCRFVDGRSSGVQVGTGAAALLDRCVLTGHPGPGLSVASNASRVTVRDSVLSGNLFGAMVRRQSDDWRRDPAMGEWRYHDEKLPPFPESALVTMTGCDLRGNKSGAFGGDRLDLLTQSGNTCDPDDATGGLSPNQRKTDSTSFT